MVIDIKKYKQNSDLFLDARMILKKLCGNVPYGLIKMNPNSPRKHGPYLSFKYTLLSDEDDKFTSIGVSIDRSTTAMYFKYGIK